MSSEKLYRELRPFITFVFFLVALRNKSILYWVAALIAMPTQMDHTGHSWIQSNLIPKPFFILIARIQESFKT